MSTREYVRTWSLLGPWVARELVHFLPRISVISLSDLDQIELYSGSPINIRTMVMLAVGPVHRKGFDSTQICVYKDSRLRII
jgi:hypothetical protein